MPRAESEAENAGEHDRRLPRQCVAFIDELTPRSLLHHTEFASVAWFECSRPSLQRWPCFTRRIDDYVPAPFGRFLARDELVGTWLYRFDPSNRGCLIDVVSHPNGRDGVRKLAAGMRFSCPHSFCFPICVPFILGGGWQTQSVPGDIPPPVKTIHDYGYDYGAVCVFAILTQEIHLPDEQTEPPLDSGPFKFARTENQPDGSVFCRSTHTQDQGCWQKQRVGHCIWFTGHVSMPLCFRGQWMASGMLFRCFRSRKKKPIRMIYHWLVIFLRYGFILTQSGLFMWKSIVPAFEVGSSPGRLNARQCAPARREGTKSIP